MKICIAQTKSERGNVTQNVQNHLFLVKRAIQSYSDLIIFPELSITNYEPELAENLATVKDDSIFMSFQELSDKNEITIGIGLPLKSSQGILITMLIFQPNITRIVYSKQMLHEDELPFFVCGNKQTILKIKGQKIGMGICYETLQREHFLKAHQKGMDIYVASVAKPKGGIEKAYRHFPKISNEFKTPILMSNCVGPCDHFMGVGQSAVWNEEGELIGQLDDKSQGLLFYDTITGQIESKQ